MPILFKRSTSPVLVPMGRSLTERIFYFLLQVRVVLANSDLLLSRGDVPAAISMLSQVPSNQNRNLKSYDSRLRSKETLKLINYRIVD